MKNKRLFITLIGSAIFPLLIAGCNMTTSSESYSSTSQQEIVEYLVTFDSQGGSNVASAKVEEGETVAKPADPSKDNNTFTGWYEEQELLHLFDFNTPITKNWTLYAGWE